jgi:hypothetical protein
MASPAGVVLDGELVACDTAAGRVKRSTLDMLAIGYSGDAKSPTSLVLAFPASSTKTASPCPPAPRPC